MLVVEIDHRVITTPNEFKEFLVDHGVTEEVKFNLVDIKKLLMGLDGMFAVVYFYGTYTIKEFEPRKETS